MNRLWYTVVQDYCGDWHVCSFLGRTEAEEKKFALAYYARVLLVTRSMQQAQYVRTLASADPEYVRLKAGE